MTSREPALVLWSINGTWLRTQRDGRERYSYLGHVGSREDVEDWCRDQGIQFVKVRTEER